MTFFNIDIVGTFGYGFTTTKHMRYGKIQITKKFYLLTTLTKCKIHVCLMRRGIPGPLYWTYLKTRTFVQASFVKVKNHAVIDYNGKWDSCSKYFYDSYSHNVLCELT